MPDRTRVSGSLTVKWDIEDGQAPNSSQSRQFLQTIARGAEETLAEHGYPAAWCWLLADPQFFKGIPPDLRQAADLLRRIAIILAHKKRGDHEAYAEDLHALYMSIHQLQFAKPAKVGQAQIDSGNEGGRPGPTQQEVRKWLKEARRRLAGNAAVSSWGVAGDIAELPDMTRGRRVIFEHIKHLWR